jgi:hypothetical protein
LSSLYSILTAGLVRPDAPCVSEAMHSLVDAVTHCRFEARSSPRGGPLRGWHIWAAYPAAADS